MIRKVPNVFPLRELGTVFFFSLAIAAICEMIYSFIYGLLIKKVRNFWCCQNKSVPLRRYNDYIVRTDLLTL